MGKRISKRTVDAAEDGTTTWDTEVPGFGLRVRNGRRVYLLKYGLGRRGRTRWVTIGTHGAPWTPQDGKPRSLTAEIARDEARRLRGLVGAGEDPALQRAATKAIPLFSEYVETYFELHQKAPRTVIENRGLVKGVLGPAFGKVRLDRIGADAVARLHVGMKDTPVRANRALALLSHMMNKAKVWGRLPGTAVNPCSGVARYREEKRTRYLEPAELRRIAKAFAAQPKDRRYGVGALRVLMFTGARESEILTLKHEDIASVSRLRAKGGPRWVHFAEPAMEVMRGLPRVPSNPYVFRGHKKGTHLTVWGLNGMWQDIRKAAKLQDVHIHDLRHSFASVGVSEGLTLPLLGLLLGHTQANTTLRYAHLMTAPGMAAAETVANAMVDLMKPEE